MVGRKNVEAIIKHALGQCAHVILQSRVPTTTSSSSSATSSSSSPSVVTTTTTDKWLNLELPQTFLRDITPYEQQLLSSSKPLFLVITLTHSQPILDTPQTIVLERWCITFDQQQQQQQQSSTQQQQSSPSQKQENEMSPELLHWHCSVLLRGLHSLMRSMPAHGVFSAMRRSVGGVATTNQQVRLGYFLCSSEEDSGYLLDQYQLIVLGRVSTGFGTFTVSCLYKSDLSREMALLSGDVLIRSQMIVHDYVSGVPSIQQQQHQQQPTQPLTMQFTTRHGGVVVAGPLGGGGAGQQMEEQVSPSPFTKRFGVPISSQQSSFAGAGSFTTTTTTTAVIGSAPVPILKAANIMAASPAFTTTAQLAAGGGGTASPGITRLMSFGPSGVIHQQQSTGGGGGGGGGGNGGMATAGYTPPFALRNSPTHQPHVSTPVFVAQQIQIRLQQQQSQQQQPTAPMTSTTAGPANSATPPRQRSYSIPKRSLPTPQVPLMNYYTPIADPSQQQQPTPTTMIDPNNIVTTTNNSNGMMPGVVDGMTDSFGSAVDERNGKESNDDDDDDGSGGKDSSYDDFMIGNDDNEPTTFLSSTVPQRPAVPFPSQQTATSGQQQQSTSPSQQQQQQTSGGSASTTTSRGLVDLGDFLYQLRNAPQLSVCANNPFVSVEQLSARYNPQEIQKLLFK